MKKFFNQKGASMVVMVTSIVVILGISALVLDIGVTMYKRQQLSNAVDAASLAAVQNIDEDEQTIINTAENYAHLNGLNPSKVAVDIGPNKKILCVSTSEEIQYYFAKVLGINNETINVSAKVKVSPITSCRGVRPLAVVNQDFEFNKQYVLKEDAGDGESGNYGAIALGGNGASIYRNNLLNGYSNVLHVGDELYTQTGNISNITRHEIQTLINKDPFSSYDNFSQDSSRIIIIPIINTLDLSGKKPIQVVGFASFFLEGVYGKGGHTEIVGRFVKYVTVGDSSESQTNYGARAVKLIK